MFKEGTYPVQSILNKVQKNQTGIFSRVPEPIVILNSIISALVGDSVVYLSEFVVAKIQGKIRNNEGHPEITEEIFLTIPNTLNNPFLIFVDVRNIQKSKYLFICNLPLHQIVVEVKRLETGKTEINTIIPLGEKTLKQLGSKFQVVYSHLY